MEDRIWVVILIVIALLFIFCMRRRNTIIYLKNFHCGFCAKQDYVLRGTRQWNMVMHVDIHTKYGKYLAGRYQIKGYPVFINLSNNKLVYGLHTDMFDVIEKLK